MREHPGDATTLAMFPLQTVLLPYESLPLHVFEPRYREMVTECLETDRRFGVVLISRGAEVGGGDERYGVGTVAAIEIVQAAEDGRFALLTRGTSRFRVLEWLVDDPYPRAVVELLTSHPDAGSGLVDLTGAERLVRTVRARWSELGRGPALEDGAVSDTEGEQRLWRLCSLTPLGPLDRQRLLEATDAADRLRVLETIGTELLADLEALLADEDP